MYCISRCQIKIHDSQESWRCVIKIAEAHCFGAFVSKPTHYSSEIRNLGESFKWPLQTLKYRPLQIYIVYVFLRCSQNPAKVPAFLNVKACKCHFTFFSVSNGSGAVNVFLPPVQPASQVAPLKSPSTTIPPVPLTPASPPSQSEVL